MAGAMAAGLKAQLDAQMEAARQQELVRIRQLDTSPVPTMVGSALDLMVDAFGTLEQRCSTMETELGDERAQRLEAERLAAEAAAASMAELTRLHVDGDDLETEQAKLEQASLRRLDDAFAKAKKGRATVLASLFLAKSKASQKKDRRELAGTILQ